MDGLTLNLIGLGAMFGLLAFGMPIGFAMAVAGFVGISFLIGWDPALALLGQTAFETAREAELSVVPLFILMGYFATHSGLSEALYRACNTWLGHRRGGLAMATIGGCGAFAAICGSSLATAATMSQVALPEMRRYNYDDRLATGAIAAGGTIGILIPPSVILVIYGILTEGDIGALFAAGVLPGVLTVILFMATVYVVVTINPALGPRGEKATGRRMLFAIKDVWGTMVLFLLVIGGIYTGAFTPTEAAGIGAIGAFNLAAIAHAANRPSARPLLKMGVGILVVLIASLGLFVAINLVLGQDAGAWPEWYRWPAFVLLIAAQLIFLWLALPIRPIIGYCLMETTKTTAMIFMILIGAILLNKFLTIGGLADFIGEWVEDLDVSPWTTMIVILLIYFVLGCALDALAMILLTIPIFFPILGNLDLGMPAEEAAIWFGVIVVMVVELGLISPPIGMNVFVIKGIATDVPLGRIYRGVLPFVAAEIVLIILLVLVPEIATWLPSTMRGG